MDAARYALARYTTDSTIDLDLDLWTKQSSDNPVFYVQYAHARLAVDPAQRRGPRADRRPTTRSTRRCSPTSRRATLLRALAEFPRVVAGGGRAARAAPGRALPRGHRRRPSTGSTTPAGCCRRATRRSATCTGPGCCWSTATRDRARQRSRPARRQRARADVRRARTRGRLRARRRSVRGPAWLRAPDDPNALVPLLWSSTARKARRRARGRRSRPVTDLVAEHGTPAYVLDEADFRSRARAFRDAFAGSDVYYAGKAFLCTAVARWVAEEGLRLDVCTGGELAVALRAGVARRPDRLPRQQQVGRRADAGRVEAGVGPDHRRLLRRDRAAGRARRRRAGRTARVMVRVTAGVEAHTHEYIATAHEDQKFGFSISRRRRPRGGPPQMRGRRRSGAARACTRHIGSQIFDTSGFEVAARRVLALHAQSLRRARRRRCPSSTSAAASASPTPPRTTRPTPRSSPPS